MKGFDPLQMLTTICAFVLSTVCVTYVQCGESVLNPYKTNLNLQITTHVALQCSVLLFRTVQAWRAVGIQACGIIPD